MKLMNRVKSCMMLTLMTIVFLWGQISVAQAKLPNELGVALNQIYNAQFHRAKATINTYMKSNPQDPAGYLLRGMANEWDQVVNNKRKANNSMILADYEKANQLAKKALESDQGNLDKKVMLGNTYMYLAKKKVDMGNKMRGGFDLKEAKNIMMDVIAKDPNNYDAYMALGVFNYFSANVPSSFKWLASLLGFNGNAAKGIQYLQKAASNKNLTQGDAGFLLVYIAEQKQKNYQKAFQYNEALRRRWPNNPDFQYESGELLFRAKKIDESRKRLNEFLAWCEKRSCHQKYKYLANYFLTWGHIEQNNYKEAKKYLEVAKKLDTKQYNDRTADMEKWTQLVSGKN